MDASAGCPGAIPFCHVFFLQTMGQLEHMQRQKRRNVYLYLTWKMPFWGPGGAGGFYRTRSASRVMRECPQLRPLKEPEPIFISVKLRRLGARGGLLAPMGHLQTLEAAEVRRFLPTTLLPAPALNVPRLLMASPPLLSLAAKVLPKLRPLQDRHLAGFTCLRPSTLQPSH